MIVAAFGVLPAIVGAWLQEAVDVISILWALRAATGSVEIASVIAPREPAERAIHAQ